MRLLPGAVLIAAMSVAGLQAAGGTPVRLIEAVKAGNRTAVRTMIAQRANVNAAEPDGMTALHYAVLSNDETTTQLLVRAGANVKAASRYGITPLKLAAENGNPAITDLLLKAGADANAATPEGETVLMTAARTGNYNVIRSLVTNGADVEPAGAQAGGQAGCGRCREVDARQGCQSERQAEAADHRAASHTDRRRVAG
jgi:ankyrin repeat protein